MHPSGEGAGVQSSYAREGTALSSSTRARGSTNRQIGPVPDVSVINAKSEPRGYTTLGLGAALGGQRTRIEVSTARDTVTVEKFWGTE